MYRLLCIVLPFLYGSCKTQIIQSSNITAVIGTDVEFRCQYNTPDKTFESVYWYLQRAGQRLTYISHASQGTVELEHYQLFVNRTLSSSTLTIKHVQPRDKALYYCAVRHHDTYCVSYGAKTVNFKANSTPEIQRVIQQDRKCSVSS